MRDPARIRPILARLATVWQQHPGMRLSQLVLNAQADPDLYYMEDGELIAKIEATYKLKE